MLIINANGRSKITDFEVLRNKIEKIISISNRPSTTYSKSLTNNLPNMTNTKTEITEKNDNIKLFSIYLSMIDNLLNLTGFKILAFGGNLKSWDFFIQNLINLISGTNFGFCIM